MGFDNTLAGGDKVGWVEGFDAVALFLGGFLLDADGYAAVGQGFGEVTNGGDGFGAPAGETSQAAAGS
jgi:hypothetical protein